MRPGDDGGHKNPWGVAAVALAGFCWAAGSLWARYNAKPESPWMNAAVQMLCGGVALLVVSLMRGEPGHFRWAQVSTQSWLALWLPDRVRLADRFQRRMCGC